MLSKLTPEETATHYGVKLEQLPIIEHIWANRNTENLFSIHLNEFNKPEMFYQVNLFMEYEGKQYNLDELIAKFLHLERNDNGIKIICYNPDMLGYTLHSFIFRCCDVVRTLNKLRKLDSLQGAAWNYNLIDNRQECNAHEKLV